MVAVLFGRDGSELKDKKLGGSLWVGCFRITFLLFFAFLQSYPVFNNGAFLHGGDFFECECGIRFKD